MTNELGHVMCLGTYADAVSYKNKSSNMYAYIYSYKYIFSPLGLFLDAWML